MRVLLDECVPDRLRRALIGHQATTVQRMRWSGVKNGALLRRASAEFDVFLTIDQSIVHQQVIPEGLALITLRLPSNAWRIVMLHVPEILEVLETIKPGDDVHLT